MITSPHCEEDWGAGLRSNICVLIIAENKTERNPVKGGHDQSTGPWSTEPFVSRLREREERRKNEPASKYQDDSKGSPKASVSLAGPLSSLLAAPSCALCEAVTCEFWPFPFYYSFVTLSQPSLLFSVSLWFGAWKPAPWFYSLAVGVPMRHFTAMKLTAPQFYWLRCSDPF